MFVLLCRGGDDFELVIFYGWIEYKVNTGEVCSKLSSDVIICDFVLYLFLCRWILRYLKVL